MKKKIFLATNGLCATKFILSMQQKKVEFYGMMTHEDILANYTYANQLTKFTLVKSGPTEVNYSNLRLIKKLFDKYKCDYIFAGYGHASENPMLSKTFGDKFMGPSFVSMAFLTDKLISTVLASVLDIPIIKYYTNYDIKKIENEFLKIKEHFNDNDWTNLPELTIFNEELKLKNFLLKDLLPEIENFPVFYKVTNSGGGKGILTVNNKNELNELLIPKNDLTLEKKQQIKFVDDYVKIESNKNIRNEEAFYFCTEIIKDARHFEVQILADKHKNIFVLGGRECSNQRRRQKLIETSIEYDDTFTEEIFTKMTDCAKKLVSSVGYFGLATVEFLFSENKFYFLEVNCRIQVEHPITEIIYKLNLPNLLYKVALNKKLDINLKMKYKYVMGVRITAETDDFLPSSGTVYVNNNLNNCISYFSTYNGVINNNSDAHFGYLFAYSNKKDKMIAKILNGIKNINISGISTPLKKLEAFIKQNKFNKSVFELENFVFSEEKLSVFLIVGAIVYFNSNKKNEVRYLYNNEIIEMNVYDCGSKLIYESSGRFTLTGFYFADDKLVLRFSNNAIIVNYEIKNGTIKYNDKLFFTQFNVIKSKITGKLISVKEEKVIIESMKIKYTIEIPKNAILLVKENDYIKSGDDFYKTEDSFNTKKLVFPYEKINFDFLKYAIQNHNVPYFNEPIKPLDYYLFNNKNEKLIPHFLKLVSETTKYSICCFLFFVFNFYTEILTKWREECKKILMTNMFFRAFTYNNPKTEILRLFCLQEEIYVTVEIPCDYPHDCEYDDCYLKSYEKTTHMGQLFCLEWLLYDNLPLIKVLGIKELTFQIERFYLKVKCQEFIETILFEKEKLLSYKINFTERNNINLRLDQYSFFDTLIYYLKDTNQKYKCTPLFLSREKPNDKNDVSEFIEGINAYGHYLSTKWVETIGMYGIIFQIENYFLVFICNNKRFKNGSFGIKEDILFYLMSQVARKNKFPKIFISNNSGARIGLVDDLYDKVELKLNELYLKEESKNCLTYDKKVVSIFGNEDTGPENLSFCSLMAKESIECYEETLTISYIQNMAVGIGAYLSKLCYRIIQKSSTCIILTGYKALNKIFKNEVYKDNLELGGKSVYKNNSMIDLFVADDLLGIESILFWCKIFYKSRKKQKLSLKNKNPEEIKLEDYFIKDWNEEHNELEIIQLLLDEFVEYNDHFGEGVRIVRGFFKENELICSLGVISAKSTILNKESCEKISNAIDLFDKEGVDMLIIANWAGFSSTKEELERNIISFGAQIIKNIVKFRQRILVYLPPNALLKGGSYVCFDKKINPNLKMFVHPTSKISILDPEGVAEIKLKNVDEKEVLFCEKHDCVYRMALNNSVDGVRCVYQLRNEVYNLLFGEEW